MSSRQTQQPPPPSPFSIVEEQLHLISAVLRPVAPNHELPFQLGASGSSLKKMAPDDAELPDGVLRGNPSYPREPAARRPVDGGEEMRLGRSRRFCWPPSAAWPVRSSRIARRRGAGECGRCGTCARATRTARSGTWCSWTMPGRVDTQLGRGELVHLLRVIQVHPLLVLVVDCHHLVRRGGWQDFHCSALFSR